MKEKLSRSQKRFHKDVTNAVDKREKLLEQNKLSLPRGLGKLAIVVSNAPDRNAITPLELQKKAFNEEADFLAEKYAKDHQQVDIIRK